MIDNILTNIVNQKRKDIEKKGFSLGSKIPKNRTRKIVSFLAQKGTILEIKRASPSKGNIAPNLNPIQLAQTYAKAGTKNISILTEMNFFKGSLEDLNEVANTLMDIAILRKDFIIFKEEIEISYLFGADAILLIARILEKEELLKLSLECIKFGMMPFIEIANQTCIDKFKYISNALKDSAISPLVGINSRDLSNFSIDTLIPSIYRKLLGDEKIVFESGIQTKESASFVANRGFYGILVGEAVAKNPTLALEIVHSFISNTLDSNKQIPKNALFWEKIASIIYQRKIENIKLPLIKICGITNANDAISAYSAGATMLGFICSTKSPRNVDSKKILEIKEILSAKFATLPLLIGIITESSSKEGQDAIKLASDGVLDAIQYHNCMIKDFISLAKDNQNIAYYVAKRLQNKNDIDIIKEFLALGNPRILVDSFSVDSIGGNGTLADETLVKKAKKLAPLWVAGGINADNICHIMDIYKPELIDICSGLEKEYGIKDINKINNLFKNLNKYFKTKKER